MFNGTIDVIIKGFTSLIFLFFVIKIMGKKQISQLNIFDYVIGISLGNIAAEMTINKDITMLNAFIAMSIYGLVSLLVSFITTKSIIARRFISGVPIVLMEHGKISMGQLKRVKLDLNDLLQDAREDGYFDLSEIDYAIMEVSGKVTFLPKSIYAPVKVNDIDIKIKENGLTANLIIDGNIMENNLKAFGKDKKWLMKQIKDNGYQDVKDILLLICNNSGKVTIYDKKYQVGRSVLE